MIFLTVAFFTFEHPANAQIDNKWYEMLRAVDSGIISDSAIHAISKDSNIVKEILHSDAESKIYKARAQEVRDSMPVWKKRDSIEAMDYVRSQLVLDSLSNVRAFDPDVRIALMKRDSSRLTKNRSDMLFWSYCRAHLAAANGKSEEVAHLDSVAAAYESMLLYGRLDFRNRYGHDWNEYDSYQNIPTLPMKK